MPPANSAEEAPKLYVPVTEAHLVSKYVGVGKVRPPLNTLGGTRWNKAKEHAERAVRDVASEMLRIQAVRESQEGHSFPPDVTWQREFEDAFHLRRNDPIKSARLPKQNPTWNAPSRWIA